MKKLLYSTILLGAIPPVFSQVNETSQWEVEILGPIADGTPSPSAEKPPLPPFSVVKTRTTSMLVTEAQELPEVPPAHGSVQATVQLVEYPNLPDPVRPLPTDSTPSVERNESEGQSFDSDGQIVFVSATVHDNSRTLVEIRSSGESSETLRAWSNINFNHLSGFASYRVNRSDGTSFDRSLVMAVGDVYASDSNQNEESHEATAIPLLPDVAESPSFVIIKGDQTGPVAQTLQQLHELYRKEAARLKAAAEARKIAYEERKAFLLAHPSQPKNVTVQIWKRPNPVGATPNVEGGNEE